MAYEPLSAEQYRQSMIAYLVSQGSGLSNFKPGSRINTLIEALSLELASADYEYFRAYREGIREACYDTFGFALKPGEKASGQVRIHNADPPQAIEIAPFSITLFGIRFLSEASPPALTEADLHIDVNIAAERPGVEYNLPENTINTDLGQGIVEPRIEGAGQVTNPSAIRGGTDQESSASRELRFQAFIQNLARVTLPGIRAAVNNIPGVVEAFVQQNINPVTEEREYGWINVFVTDGTANISREFLERVENYLEGRLSENNFTAYIPPGSRLHVSTIKIQAINISLSITIDEKSALTDSETTELAKKAITEYVNRLGAGEDVLLNHIISSVIEARKEDIIYVQITNPQADIAVPAQTLPRIGGTGGGAVTLSSITRIARP